jgi:hypothetical protein
LDVSGRAEIVARPAAPVVAASASYPAERRVDRLAVASAVCGLTALVPVLSQLAGLAFGIASLRRIRRARRCGFDLPGTGWAAAGIVSSVLMLLCWIAVFAAFVFVGKSLAHTNEAMSAIMPSGG